MVKRAVAWTVFLILEFGPANRTCAVSFEPFPAHHVNHRKSVMKYGPKHALFEDVATGQGYDAGTNWWAILGDGILREVVGMSNKVRSARKVRHEAVTEAPAVVVLVEGRKEPIVVLELGLVAGGLKVIYKCPRGTECAAARAPARFVIGLREVTTTVRSERLL